MRVPLRWIREYVDISASAEEIAERLTMAGTEVTEVARIGAEWDRVVIGRVDELARHGAADNLSVAKVDVGREQLTLVTAATNLREGDVVPVVRAGGRLSGDRVVEIRRFRGVRSEGMLCSGDELGISSDAESIYVLEASAPLGADLRDYLADDVLAIELTPNRPDCLGIVGIAREIAAVTGAPLRLPWAQTASPHPSRSQDTEGGSLRSRTANPVLVSVDDGDLCPRYTAAFLEGVRIAPSPQWLQRRLHLCGIRCINNVVDVTNYVMLELGQPLHAFDADRLKNMTIRVRRARTGERITTIDGLERELPPDALVIADAEAPVAIAGIMGGLGSEISPSTTRIVLESATFDGLSIRRTSRALHLATEASKRFDKGLDAELPPLASRRAISMLVQLSGAKAPESLADVVQPEGSRRTIPFTASDVAGLIGQSYSQEQIERSLSALGFELERHDDQFRAVVPRWRGDVEGKADIAEEVARIVGYDAIPTRLPSGAPPPPAEDPVLRWEAALRSALAAAGLQEVITYSLVDPYAVGKLDANAPYPPTAPDSNTIPVCNPMSVEHSRLRTTLLPSLLATVGANLRYQRRVAIFEIARVFLAPLAPLPREERRLGIAMAGRRAPDGWNTSAENLDFYDLRAAVEAAFRGLHVQCSVLASPAASWLHPVRGACLRAEGQDVGLMGQVHPRVAERFDIQGVEAYVAEIDLGAVLALAREEIAVRPLPRYPAVQRDLAFIVEEQVTHRQLSSVIRAAAGPLLESLALFDVYRGAPVPEGQISLAYALTFRAPDRTLADEEMSSAVKAIEREIANRLGGRLRGAPLD